MALKPWYDVVKPREDLREGKPLDASEFAVHLDQVRDGRAHDDYQKPDRFFAKTVLTTNLVALAGEVVRRLNGIKTQANAVFNMTTQFGGGKTHALTLLYHLAKGGEKAKSFEGVDKILAKGEVTDVPSAQVAVFVGTEFDSVKGRGGANSEPLRRTPWGEIAWQLGGKEAFKNVEEHEKQQIAPSAEVIRDFLPKDKPTLILLDELMNYVSRNRKSGLAGQLYNFLQNLSEESRGQNRVVLCVSIPASELEMTAEDHTEYDRFKKLLDRLGKPIIMSSDTETSEIIRRRLFEWEPGGLPRDAEKTIAGYAEWCNEKRNQIPSWFPVDHAREQFRASYPFHPSVLSVFERKWQELPRFQQTRGILKMLALWVSKAYSEGYKGGQRDPLIGLGTAPLDDSIFRTAVFEQIGESKLEGAVTTDICGKRESHATRLDQEASPDIKKARLHRKVMTTIFFESNGGQSKGEATEPEIRLAVGEPDWDIGHIDTVLETLNQACYYLNSERRRFRFSLSPNLNKLLADRRANISPQKIDERVRAEVKKAFAKTEGIDVALFPEKSGAVTDRPALTLAVMPPEQTMEDGETKKLIESMTREHGKSARTYKTGVIWCAAHSTAKLKDEARKLLAWEDIQSEEDTLRLDDGQKTKLAENIEIAKRSIAAALDNPDSRRRFVKITAQDELERILDAPLEKWRIFLHPTQEDLVHARFNGSARVLGGAGTGKTVVAMHRARHLAKDVFPGPQDRVLFTTFTGNLASDVQQNLRRLCGPEFDRIEVVHLHAWAARYLRRAGVGFTIAGDDDVRVCWEAAVRPDAEPWTAGFLAHEWDQVVQAQGIDTEAAYLTVPRIGRGQTLSKSQRVQVWRAFERFSAELRARGLKEWLGVIREARQRLQAAEGAPLYRAVVVDEAQDFHAEEWRLIRAIAAPGPNDLFIVGDAHQRIYGRKVTLSRCGVNVVGRSRKLKINYRTTEQIRAWAVALLNRDVDDLDGGGDDHRGYMSLLSGPPPQVEHFDAAQDEKRFLA